jgi:hypothetical protein
MRNFRRVGFLSVSLALGLAASAQQQQSDVAPATAPTGRIVTGIVVPPSGGNTNASVQLFNNGTWITQTGVGVGGADISEIEPGLNVYGLNVNGGASIRLADDFTVPASTNWTLTDMKWRGYQTNAPTTGTFTGATVQVLSGPPPGGAVVAGDLTTNRYVSHVFSNVYRVNTGQVGQTARAVMDIKVDMSFVPSLSPGTYWVNVALIGTSTSGPWTNVTVPWDPADNGMQFFGGTWNVTTSGQSASPVDFPYELEGNTGCTGSVSVYCTSKVNSAGCTPSIGSTGSPSATAGSGFVVSTTNELDNKFGLYFYSKTGPNSSAFQGGFLCGMPPLTRTSILNSGGTPPCNGMYSIDFNSYIASGKDPALVSGQSVWLQTWSRDPASPSTTNLSNAITFTICP